MKNIILIIAIVYSLVISYLYFKEMTPTIEDYSQVKIDSLNNVLSIERLKADTLKKEILSFEKELENKKNNIQVIKEKYEVIRNNIVKLDDSASVMLLSKYLSQEGSNK